jgi:FkbM family methyltransferase
VLKSTIKRAIHSVGFDLKRYVTIPPDQARLMTMLSAHHVNLVFDVGANVGQFAKSLREIGYRGRIVSFEPLQEAWETLRQVSKTDPLWEIAPRGAIGAEDGEIEFHVAGDSQSSSILSMLDFTTKIIPEASYVGSVRVPLQRLDTVGPSYLCLDSVLFIKVDVQGFEDRVLKGASELLKRAVGLCLEVELVPLYEGQLLFHDILSDLVKLGFELWDLKPEYFDPEDARLIWGCGVFFRR